MECDVVMFDMTEIIIGQTQTILNNIFSESNLAIYAILISIISLCISIYNTIASNRSSISVKLYSKHFFDEESKKTYMEAEISIVNKSRRTKYINSVALTYSPIPQQRYFIVTQDQYKIEPEEEIKIPVHLDRSYLQKEHKPTFVRAIIRDTKGKKWRSRDGIGHSELQMIVEKRRVNYITHLD